MPWVGDRDQGQRAGIDIEPADRGHAVLGGHDIHIRSRHADDVVLAQPRHDARQRASARSGQQADDRGTTGRQPRAAREIAEPADTADLRAIDGLGRYLAEQIDRNRGIDRFEACNFAQHADVVGMRDRRELHQTRVGDRGVQRGRAQRNATHDRRPLGVARCQRAGGFQQQQRIRHHARVHAQVSPAHQRTQHGRLQFAQPELQGVAVIDQCCDVGGQLGGRRIGRRIGEFEQRGVGLDNGVDARTRNARAAGARHARIDVCEYLPRIGQRRRGEVGGDPQRVHAVGIRRCDLQQDDVESVRRELPHELAVGQRLQREAAIGPTRTPVGREEDTAHSRGRMQRAEVEAIHARNVHAAELHAVGDRGHRAKPALEQRRVPAATGRIHADAGREGAREAGWIELVHACSILSCTHAARIGIRPCRR